MKLRDNLKAKTNVVVTQVTFVFVRIKMMMTGDYGFRTQAAEDVLQSRRKRKRRRKGTQWRGDTFTFQSCFSENMKTRWRLSVKKHYWWETLNGTKDWYKRFRKLSKSPEKRKTAVVKPSTVKRRVFLSLKICSFTTIICRGSSITRSTSIPAKETSSLGAPGFLGRFPPPPRSCLKTVDLVSPVFPANPLIP